MSSCGITPMELQEMRTLAYEIEQGIADVIALAKVAAHGLSDEVYDGQHSMLDAKHTIQAIARLLEHMYDEYAYPLSFQLGDLVFAMQQPTETPTSEGDDHA